MLNHIEYFRSALIHTHTVNYWVVRIKGEVEHEQEMHGLYPVGSFLPQSRYYKKFSTLRDAKAHYESIVSKYKEANYPLVEHGRTENQNLRRV